MKQSRFSIKNLKSGPASIQSELEQLLRTLDADLPVDALALGLWDIDVGEEPRKNPGPVEFLPFSALARVHFPGKQQ